MLDKCSCVILNYNDYHTTINLIRKISNYKCINKIIVVDNCSTDHSVIELSNIDIPNLVLIKAECNGGYGAGNNIGIKYAFNNLKDKYVLIANPDVSFSEQLIENLIMTINENKQCILTSALQKDRNGNYIQDIAWKNPSIFDMIFMDFKPFRRVIFKRMHYTSKYFSSAKSCVVDCVPGAMLLVDTEKFISIGGYDENMFLYCEETYLGLRIAKSNYCSILYCNDSYEHLHSVSISKSIKSEMTQYRLIVKERIYLLNKYMDSNILHVLLAYLVYSFVIFMRLVKKYLGFNRGNL